MLSTVYLAAEDEPGLAVGRKLVEEVPPLTIYTEENARGFGGLKNKTPNFQRMAAQGLPVLMLTDLDNRPCPSKMINDWMVELPNAGFLFRICVREIEAWLLAHRAAMARFLGVSEALISRAPESLADPKAALIALSQKSPKRKIRIRFKSVGSATIGPDYNQFLGEFIREFWDADIAAKTAPSLARARKHLRQLAASIAS